MRRLALLGWIAAAFTLLTFNAATAANTGITSYNCNNDLTRAIPSRSSRAPSGSALTGELMNLSGPERDAVVTRQILSGNLPKFLRHLVPVNFTGTLSDGENVQVTICVTPDYLSVGTDLDFVRMPMGLPAAAQIADKLGFMLPTTKMVDAIYAQAAIHLAPSPMQPTNQMSSTDYLSRHNQTVEGQRTQYGMTMGTLIAGQKKDLVLTKRLLSAPGRVAIYGWHRTNGRPIQPLSTVHGAQYADYSHGIRLVSRTAYVNGHAEPLADIMQDGQLSKIVSSEGPIAHADGLQASLYR